MQDGEMGKVKGKVKKSKGKRGITFEIFFKNYSEFRIPNSELKVCDN